VVVVVFIAKGLFPKTFGVATLESVCGRMAWWIGLKFWKKVDLKTNFLKIQGLFDLEQGRSSGNCFCG